MRLKSIDGSVKSTLKYSTNAVLHTIEIAQPIVITILQLITKIWSDFIGAGRRQALMSQVSSYLRWCRTAKSVGLLEYLTFWLLFTIRSILL
jgi:tRNA threonylcarbamoyladenosine modification (KEOPS) complex  Pcc1 subunit